MIIEESNLSKLLKKIIPILIVVILIIVTISLIVGKINYSKKEKSLKKSLEEYGIPFYHNYYDQLVKQDNVSSLERYTAEGIKIELETISKNNDEVKNIFKDCNNKNTIVIIYPESPFSKTDFKVDSKLDCDI